MLGFAKKIGTLWQKLSKPWHKILFWNIMGVISVIIMPEADKLTAFVICGALLVIHLAAPKYKK